MILVVTGGAGFIGSHVVDAALARGYEVVVLDDLSSGSPANVDRRARLVVGDVSRLQDVMRLAEAARGDEVAIAHLAAVVGVAEAAERPSRAVEVNVLGTANVVELARRLDAYVAFASSAAVYGEPERLPVDEGHPLRPASLYGLTKAQAEGLLAQAARDYGIRYSALRLFNVYGERMRPGPYASVVYNFIRAALRGERPRVFGDGRATRDFVYVGDVAEAFLAAVERRAEGPVNVGTGRETSVLELLELVGEVTGRRLEPSFEPPRPGDVRRSAADIARAREVLGWSPRVGLREGLRRAADYMARLGS